MHSRYDAIVVGARCAGASTAMLLARAGLRVLAIDRDPPGKDSLSTHALMRAGVLQLRRWDLLDRLESAGTPAIRTTAFHYGDETIEVPIKPRNGVDALYAPRRTVLDVMLAEAARASGAEVLHGVSAVDLLHDADGRVTGAVLRGGDGLDARVRAGIVIGADGLRSRVARLAGAGVERSGRHATAVIYGYFENLQAGGYHWHYRPRVSAGVIPTNDGLTCVFASMPARRFLEHHGKGLEPLFHQVLLENSARLARAVGAAKGRGKLHPFPGAAGFLRRSWGPGWALVGDAGFFRDPLTAHGITDALRDAELLASAVVRGSERELAAYQAARDEIAVGMMELSDAIASFEWDLEEVKVMHLDLSRLMNAEVELLRGRTAPGSVPEATCPMSRPVAAVGS